MKGPTHDEDEDAFRRAVAGARPLPARTAPSPGAPKPPPVARFARARRGATLTETPHAPPDPALTGPGDELLFRRPWLTQEVLRRLRRGQIAVEAEVDLHGLHRLAAREALHAFLAEALARNLRCVRVIHGKGLRSGPGGPVLKHVVSDWLARIDAVAGFASAPPAEGGTGAVLVLFGRRPAAPHSENR
jgi:DNA-nicking Smr family endonuclease